MGKGKEWRGKKTKERVKGVGSSPEAHLTRMVFRVRVRVRPFSRSHEVRFWTRPKGVEGGERKWERS